MKVLVVNLFLDDELADQFEQEMARVMTLPGRPVELTFIRPKNDPLVRPPEAVDHYSRLLLSGSEASALEDNPWDEALIDLLKAFADRGKPVFGICYGHQFIIRALLGRGHVRRRADRVWGWLAVDLADSRLTRGLDRVVSTICNSDEVFDLPEEFRVLAGADHCGVLAFEHRDWPIWGVQFHPEYEQTYGQSVIDFSVEEEQPGTFRLVDHRRGEKPLDPNLILFRNFLQA